MCDRHPIVGTLINVATVVAGTAIGTAVGPRLTEGVQQRVLAGLGLITLVLGVDLALAWGGPTPRPPHRSTCSAACCSEG